MDADNRIVRWYRDEDGDRFGNSSIFVDAPIDERPAGYVHAFGDCDDTSRVLRPYDACFGSDDLDRDGLRATEVGGNDCDDFDVNRYPGNVETRDRYGHEDDCDPETHGNNRWSEYSFWPLTRNPDFLTPESELRPPLPQLRFDGGPLGNTIGGRRREG